ncbi:response regulator [Zhihengliuella sp.]|uniref:response regulator transcription factor n=1 Tax=Zhihengliuella sp. TaxID=1954483 RepID=UPI00281138F5|nr:response regulator [Zhihengliuella sp.]
MTGAEDESTIRTLIVDDDPDVVRMHRLFVEAADGFEVAGTLGRGAEVEPFLAAEPVDLILLDVHLPDANGVDVLERLRAAGHRAGVIMITAAAEAETVRSALGSGIDDYLVKPFTVVEFTRRLQMFRSSRATRASESGGTRDRDAVDPARQAAVDELVGGARGEAAAGVTGGPASDAPAKSLPKGFSQPTLDLVAGALRELTGPATDHGTAAPMATPSATPDASAAEVARACGISKVSARRYLDLLTRQDRAELRPRYGSAGRPEHRYRWRP